MKYNTTPIFSALTCFILLFSQIDSAHAANLLVHIKDSKQNLLKDTVVYLEALNPTVGTQKQAPKKGIIRQRNKMYIPFVSVFQKGTAVSFINQDKFKHHVYSFSNAKKFEIKLYSGKPPKSTLFNNPGTVTLGCNIHDHMLAYAYIVDTPFYALSANTGKAVLRNIPNGKYRLKLWHPYLKIGKPLEKIISIPVKNNAVSYQLQLKPLWRKILKKRMTDYKKNDDTYLEF